MVTASQAQYGPAYDILIVDNKELTRDTVQKILQQEGYTVDTARHGKEGIEKVRTNNYAYRLVITELIMPYAGGFEVIKTIKKESRIPVMVLSAVADEDTINESFRLSADDFLKKPFMASELVQRIQRLLIRHAAPVYPKTVVVPVVPVAPAAISEAVSIEDRAAEAVVAKRKRSIKKAAAAESNTKTVVIKKAAAPKKATAAKVTASKMPVKKKTEKEKVTAAGSTTAKTKTTAAKTKTTATKTAPSKGSGSARKPAVAVKPVAVAKKAAEKKDKSGSAKKATVKKVAGTAIRTGKATSARGKSKLIIRNSTPLIRRIPQATGTPLQLKAGNMGSGFCAIAV